MKFEYQISAIRLSSYRDAVSYPYYWVEVQKYCYEAFGNDNYNVRYDAKQGWIFEFRYKENYTQFILAWG